MERVHATRVLSLLVLALAGGCGDGQPVNYIIDFSTPVVDMAVAPPRDGDAPPDLAPAKVPVSVAVRVRNPNGRNIYVGAFPEVPTGMLDTSKMLELGN